MMYTVRVYSTGLVTYAFQLPGSKAPLSPTSRQAFKREGEGAPTVAVAFSS